jgi:CheY-like chemotaxis protein
VDDLLEVSRITQGKVVLQRKTVRLKDVLDTAIDTASPYLEAQRHQLKTDFAFDADELWLEVDPVRLSQVVSNLLHNAAKFTPAGGQITLRARAVDDGMEIVVEDNGVGMGADVLPTVFELFTQGSQSLDRAQGGLGIGLSLVKGMIEMHGGSVTAESEGPGHGSRFRVWLPASVRSQRRVVAPRSAVVTQAQPRRILVVEDNVDAAEAMQLLLEGMGHSVTVVNDGADALRVASEMRPDLVLLDIGLPGVNGYELARRLRDAPETQAAHLVAVTGYGQAKDRARSLEAGFDMHLVKPVDPAQLRDVVGQLGT